MSIPPTHLLAAARLHLRARSVATWSAAAAAMLGCGTAPLAPALGTDAGAELADGSTTDATPDAEPDATTLAPVARLEQSALASGVPELVVGDAPTFVIDATVTLLLDAAVPDTFDITFAGRAFATCGALDGEFSFTSLESLGDPPVDAELRADRVHLTLRDVGDGLLVLGGAYTPLEPGERCGTATIEQPIPAELRVNVRVRRLGRAAVVFPGCPATSPLRAVGGGRIGPVVVDAYDEGDEAAYFANVEGLPTTVVLSSDAGAPVTDSTLSFIDVPEGATRMTIAPAIGPPVEVEVVTPNAIDGADVRVELGGVAGSPVLVEDGASFVDVGWGRVSNRLVPTLQDLTIGGVAVCTDPVPGWFELTTSTPDVCVPRTSVPGELGGWLVLSGTDLGLSAELLADGRCELRVAAPALAGGDGLTTSVGAEFANVWQMMDIP
ncbi:MAG: hypothetical protein H6700_02570 [Myxococcales bacterium]|nr:hypothetical protein [Myxococcales bacterium]